MGIERFWFVGVDGSQQPRRALVLGGTGGWGRALPLAGRSLSYA